MKPSLTPQQEQCLAVITAYLSSHGYPPTMQEIADRMGISTKSTAHVHVRALVTKGYIEIVDRQPRAMRVVA